MGSFNKEISQAPDERNHYQNCSSRTAGVSNAAMKAPMQIWSCNNNGDLLPRAYSDAALTNN